MTGHFEDFDGPELELAQGRQAPMFTVAYDWVTLSGISPAAIALYLVLRMHLNRERGDKVCWPSTLSLAVILGRSRGDKISSEIQELVGIGAIEVSSWGMPRRHKYTVNDTPPDGYTGPTTAKEWYEANNPRLDEIRAADKAARDARREAKKANPQVTPVTPISGEQEDEAPVTPDRGEQVTPDRGQHVAPISGGKLVRKGTSKKGTQKNSPPSPPADGSAAAARAGAATEGGEISEEDKHYLQAGLEKALGLRKGWDPVEVKKVMWRAVRSGRDPRHVGIAIATAANDSATVLPNRILNELWWIDNMPQVVDRTSFGPPCPKHPGNGNVVGKCVGCKVDAQQEELDRKRAELAAAEPPASADEAGGRTSARTVVSAASRRPGRSVVRARV